MRIQVGADLRSCGFRGQKSDDELVTDQECRHTDRCHAPRIGQRSQPLQRSAILCQVMEDDVQGRLLALKVIEKIFRCLTVGTATPYEHFDIGRRLVRLDSGPVCQQ